MKKTNKSVLMLAILGGLGSSSLENTHAAQRFQDSKSLANAEYLAAMGPAHAVSVMEGGRIQKGSAADATGTASREMMNTSAAVKPSVVRVPTRSSNVPHASFAKNKSKKVQWDHAFGSLIVGLCGVLLTVSAATGAVVFVEALICAIVGPLLIMKGASMLKESLQGDVPGHRR